MYVHTSEILLIFLLSGVPTCYLTLFECWHVSHTVNIWHIVIWTVNIHSRSLLTVTLMHTVYTVYSINYNLFCLIVVSAWICSVGSWSQTNKSYPTSNLQFLGWISWVCSSFLGFIVWWIWIGKKRVSHGLVTYTYNYCSMNILWSAVT